MAEGATLQPVAMPKKRLIFVVPAIRYQPRVWGYKPAWEPLMERICAELSGAAGDGSQEWTTDWCFIDHGVHTFSIGSALQRAREVRAYIGQELASEGDDCDDIVLVGHSLGGVLARQAYLQALGIGDNENESKWVTRVSRIVLFATINNGVDLEKWGLVGVAVRIAKWTGFLRVSIFRHVLEGSPFIANLRVEWMRNVSPRTCAGRMPALVQVIGSRDSMVSRDESLDEALGASHVEVPGANHADLYQCANDDQRYRLLRAAFLGPPLPTAKPTEATKREAIVFLLHGIRASNSGWVEQLRSRIAQRLPRVEVVTSSYGFFSIFNFALPWLRKKNIPWFLNEYSYQFERNPGASFHFVGHSNGTYILAQSLVRVPALRFKRVVLMGSPLPRQYDWREHLDTEGSEGVDAAPRVQEVQNHRSSADFVVALVANGLRGLGPLWHDIGVAGFSGFDASHSRLREFYYYAGDHSAPMKTGASLDNIADYVCTGAIRTPDNCSTANRLPRWSGFPMRLMPYLTLIVALALLAVDCALLWSWILTPLLHESEELVPMKVGSLLAAHVVAYVLAKTV